MVGKYDMRNWAICENNSAVECYDSTKCHKCGWNPIVAKRRIYVLRVKQDKGTLAQKKKEEAEVYGSPTVDAVVLEKICSPQMERFFRYYAKKYGYPTVDEKEKEK